MSYSDSELKNDIREKIRRHLLHQVKFKPIKKYPAWTPQEIRALKSRVKPIGLELRLLYAVNTHNTDEVKKLLAEGVSPNTTDSEFRSVLHLAVTKEYADIVQLLLQYGADPNKRDLIYNTPLHLAACIHNLPIVTMLINAKADIDSEDSKGRNPLDLARSKLRILLKNLRSGSIEMMKLKLELEQVVDFLLCLLHHRLEEKKEAEKHAKMLINQTELQLVKLSISSGENLDGKMTKLLEDIEHLNIK